MYAAARVYLKNCILRNFAFYNFSKYLGSETYARRQDNVRGT